MIEQKRTFGYKPFLFQPVTGEYISHDGFKVVTTRFGESVKIYSPSGRLLMLDESNSRELLTELKYSLHMDEREYNKELTDWKAANPNNLPVMKPNKRGPGWVCANGDYTILQGDETSPNWLNNILYSKDGVVLNDNFDLFNENYTWVHDKHFSEGRPVCKISPGHLTKGTVFKTAGFMSRTNGRPDGMEHVVKSLTTNSPGHYLIETERLVPDIINEKKMVNDTFSIRFVSEIVKRGSEESVIVPSTIYIPYREPNAFDTLTELVLLQVMPILNGTDQKDRIINPAKLAKRLKQMGLVKWDRFSRATITDLKKARKFLKKNPHWAFYDLKFSYRDHCWGNTQMYADLDF